MPNRSASEREPEYQELIAGRSPHKGIIDLAPDSLQVAKDEPAKDEPAPVFAPSAKIGLLERVSHLFGRHRN